MRIEEIEKAIHEAQRFIACAKSCIETRNKSHTTDDFVLYSNAPKESGALRRASLDLTRQLAEMRRP